MEVLRGMLAELSVRLAVPTESAKIQQAIHDVLPGGDSEIGDVLTVGIMRAGQCIGLRLAPVELTASEVW